MELLTSKHGNTLIVTVGDSRIDAAVAVQFKDRMKDVMGDEPPRVVLDLKNVDFLDSSGLGAVVAVMKLLGPGRRLELCGLGATVEKVLKLTRMDTVFNIHTTVKDALAQTSEAS